MAGNSNTHLLNEVLGTGAADMLGSEASALSAERGASVYECVESSLQVNQAERSMDR